MMAYGYPANRDSERPEAQLGKFAGALWLDGDGKSSVLHSLA